MKNQNGFTIIETLIAIAILTIVGLGFAQLMDYTNQHLKHAQRKLESLELRSAVSSALSDQAICSCLMGMYAEPIDSTDLSKESSVSEVRSTCSATGSIVVKSNSEVPGTNAHLKTAIISLANIQSLGVANQYRAKLRIRFQNDPRFVSLRPLELEGRFSTKSSDPADKKTIEYCNFTGNAFAPPITGASAQTCPSGQFVTGIDNGIVSCSPGNSGNSGSGNSGTTTSTSTSTDTTTVASLDPLTVTSYNPYGNQNPYSPANPGPGCTGQGCITYDYGPCTGQSCKTNGMQCKGQHCCAGYACF